MSSLPPPLPVQHPQQQLMSSRGKEKPDRRGGAQTRTGKGIRERALHTAVSGFINNRVQKNRWVWRPLSAHLPVRGLAWAAWCPPCPGQGLLLGRLPYFAKALLTRSKQSLNPSPLPGGPRPYLGCPCHKSYPIQQARSPPPHFSLPGSGLEHKWCNLGTRLRRGLSADKIWVGGWTVDLYEKFRHYRQTLACSGVSRLLQTCFWALGRLGIHRGRTCTPSALNTVLSLACGPESQVLAELPHQRVPHAAPAPLSLVATPLQHPSHTPRCHRHRDHEPGPGLPHAACPGPCPGFGKGQQPPAHTSAAGASERQRGG